MNKWPIVLSLILTYLIFSLLLNSVGTVVFQVIHDYGISKQNASILEGFKDIPIALVSFLFASFLPRLGYKTALQTGLFITLLACMAMPLFPGFMTTKLMFLAVGISFPLAKVSIYAYVGLITKNKNQHASMLNTMEGFFMLGVLGGYWLFSLFINDNSGFDDHWLQIYWFISGLCAINMLCLYLIKMPEPKFYLSHSMSQDFNSMLKLIIKPLVFVFIISSFLYVLLEQSIGTWLPTFNNEILLFPRAMSIQAAGIFAGALVTGRFLSSLLLQRIHWYTLLSICVLAMSLLILLVLPLTENIHSTTAITWQNAPMTHFLLPMIGLFMAPIYPVINSLILSSLPKAQHAAMTGLIMFFSALGGTTGSLITGNLFAMLGGRTAFYLLLLPLCLLYFSFYGFRYLTERNLGT